MAEISEEKKKKREREELEEIEEMERKLNATEGWVDPWSVGAIEPWYNPDLASLSFALSLPLPVAVSACCMFVVMFVSRHIRSCRISVRELQLQEPLKQT
eukprot:gnl/TRDRNA2_/TRDRNA2_126669_c2_seq1.p2 gnl/TRDRNA2_/TRDRNA2_126669_c2~~gnl/TRDRNA2_/TRDRNA2_126669_c2_seq1.p2  ORF type:complete len:100 (-),score=21.04 gnl/TRDRNA2_/TRDRNA2_126669_c2_seq1:151-450(-)